MLKYILSLILVIWAGAAQAQLPLTGAGAGAVSSGPAATNLAFINHYEITTGTTANAYTQTVSFGASPSTYRTIVVAFGGRGSGTSLTAMTIGGVNALSNCTTPGTVSLNLTVICSATVGTSPANTDIVITFNAAMSRGGLAVYEMTSAHPAPSTSGSDNTSTTIATQTLTIPSNGSGLGVGYCIGASSATWTGIASDFAFTQLATTGNWYNSASSNTPGSTIMKVTYNLACSPNALGTFATFIP